MLWFDLDDTIWAMTDNSSDVLRGMWHDFPLISRAFPDGEEAWLDVYHSVNADLWRRYAAAEITQPFLRLERFARPLEIGGIPRREAVEASKEFDSLYLWRLGSCSRLLPGARELLEETAARFPSRKPGIISNGFREVQHRKLSSSGIDGFFGAVILSDNFGVNKPDPRLFDHALRATGTRADESIMVGDNPVTDVWGALNAGWRHAVWFNPHHTPTPPELDPFGPDRLTIVHSLADVPDACARALKPDPAL